MYGLKKFFEERGKKFTGVSARITENCAPVKVGGIEGTTTGLYLWFNHTNETFDDQHGHGCLRPGEIAMFTSFGNASTYSKYAVLTVDQIVNEIGLLSHPLFKFRRDDCSKKNREKMASAVEELNLKFKLIY